MQDENEEESPARKIWVGIGWYPNTNFYGVDTKLLFGNHFRPQSTSQQGGDDVTIKKRLDFKVVVKKLDLLGKVTKLKLISPNC